mmetsp:Transcript_38339/g.118498  ORF Transcript_38339/g.118498 Transcript_38339/m.118498 type:complete len:279 (-) Transcript_38339:184-1020(-)
MRLRSRFLWMRSCLRTLAVVRAASFSSAVSRSQRSRRRRSRSARSMRRSCFRLTRFASRCSSVGSSLRIASTSRSTLVRFFSSRACARVLLRRHVVACCLCSIACGTHALMFCTRGVISSSSSSAATWRAVALVIWMSSLSVTSLTSALMCSMSRPSRRLYSTAILSAAKKSKSIVCFAWKSSVSVAHLKKRWIVAAVRSLSSAGRPATRGIIARTASHAPMKDMARRAVSSVRSFSNLPTMASMKHHAKPWRKWNMSLRSTMGMCLWSHPRSQKIMR